MRTLENLAFPGTNTPRPPRSGTPLETRRVSQSRLSQLVARELKAVAARVDHVDRIPGSAFVLTYAVHLHAFSLDLPDQILRIAGPFNLEGVVGYAGRPLLGQRQTVPTRRRPVSCGRL